ncbi:1-deoxy-D-xylulose-5-phosphate reductoisomerase [Candidatus Peregrinibacteria bacterium]|nr:1-deoxy-D-xylulose-5-phosphate reductoisomerase [Candidatus Peregrinibacteria bacterium]
MKKRLVLIGATGSVGTNVLDIVRKNPDDFTIMGLTAHTDTDALHALQHEFQPPLGVTCAVSDMSAMVCDDRVDMVVVACLGTEVREMLLAAIKHKKEIAIATKELLVEYGHEIMREAKRNGVTILPVDSEHSGVFQLLEGNRHRTLEKITLTCSGGPFLHASKKMLQSATVKQALQHPTWDMGKKISIDSATMMNKALEIIEAHHLFDIEPENIEVLVHPQSLVHAMVHFSDGTSMAHMGHADMRIPIHYALYYPESSDAAVPKLDLAGNELVFEKPDTETFPSILFAYEALKKGGDYPKRLNRANDRAVKLFMEKKIRFDEIFQYIKEQAFAT